jgi:hypothetical protein
MLRRRDSLRSYQSNVGIYALVLCSVNANSLELSSFIASGYSQRGRLIGLRGRALKNPLHNKQFCGGKIALK